MLAHGSFGICPMEVVAALPFVASGIAGSVAIYHICRHRVVTWLTRKR